MKICDRKESPVKRLKEVLVPLHQHECWLTSMASYTSHPVPALT